MPYLGASFSAEGSVDGLLPSIDQVHELNPRLLLHGYEPLTRIFSSSAMLDELRIQLAWLRDEVMRLMKGGVERNAIQQRIWCRPRSPIAHPRCIWLIC